MDVTCSHNKNPALGWDLTAIAKAEEGEKIVRVQIIVNDFSRYDKSFNPSISSFQQQLSQQGEYPGENTVRVVVTNDQGEDTDSYDSWS